MDNSEIINLIRDLNDCIGLFTHAETGNFSLNLEHNSNSLLLHLERALTEYAVNQNLKAAIVSASASGQGNSPQPNTVKETFELALSDEAHGGIQQLIKFCFNNSVPEYEQLGKTLMRILDYLKTLPLDEAKKIQALVTLLDESLLPFMRTYEGFSTFDVGLYRNAEPVLLNMQDALVKFAATQSLDTKIEVKNAAGQGSTPQPLNVKDTFKAALSPYAHGGVQNVIKACKERSESKYLNLAISLEKVTDYLKTLKLN